MKITAPIWSPGSSAGAAPAWPGNLSGKTIGLLHNTKTHGDLVLECLAEELTRASQGVSVRRVCKPNTSIGIDDPKLRGDYDEMRGCDAVLIALGD